MTDDRPPEALRLEQARIKRGFASAKDAARFFGWKYNSYIQHERGERGLKKAADRYAHAYGVTAGWLLTGEGENLRHELPIMGYIGAGAEILPEFEQIPHEGLDQIDLPFAVPPDLIGLEVRGDSMLPRYEDGDVVVVWRDQRGAFDALLGEEAAVRTDSGQRFLKRLLRGGRKGTYNLESTNASSKTIEGVRLEWASEVYLTVRAAHIRRIAARERAVATRRSRAHNQEVERMAELPLTGNRQSGAGQ